MEALLEQVKILSDDNKLVFFQKSMEDLPFGLAIRLVHQLEDAWDVVAKATVPDFGGQAPEEDEEVEQTAFDVVVTAAGSSRISAVKASSGIMKSTLKEANELLKEFPAVILTGVALDEAKVAQMALEATGATVIIR